MKKVLSLLLVSMLAFNLMGCNGSNNTTAPVTQNTTSSESVTMPEVSTEAETEQESSEESEKEVSTDSETAPVSNEEGVYPNMDSYTEYELKRSEIDAEFKAIDISTLGIKEDTTLATLEVDNTEDPQLLGPWSSKYGQLTFVYNSDGTFTAKIGGPLVSQIATEETPDKPLPYTVNNGIIYSGGVDFVRNDKDEVVEKETVSVAFYKIVDDVMYRCDVFDLNDPSTWVTTMMFRGASEDEITDSLAKTLKPAEGYDGTYTATVDRATVEWKISGGVLTYNDVSEPFSIDEQGYWIIRGHKFANLSSADDTLELYLSVEDKDESLENLGFIYNDYSEQGMGKSYNLSAKRI